jgi:UrcA family protein
MPFARLSLSAVAVAGLSMAFTGTPAQAQYADDPAYAYDHPAPGYYPPPPPAYAPPADYEDAGPTVGEVIIVAPRHRSERDSATGAPIERVYASRRVRYDDLDLTSDWGVRTLHARVVRAAETACNYLDRRYATLDQEDHSCVDDAVRDAMRQAPLGESVDAAYEGP